MKLILSLLAVLVSFTAAAAVGPPPLLRQSLTTNAEGAAIGVITNNSPVIKTLLLEAQRADTQTNYATNVVVSSVKDTNGNEMLPYMPTNGGISGQVWTSAGPGNKPTWSSSSLSAPPDVSLLFGDPFSTNYSWASCRSLMVLDSYKFAATLYGLKAQSFGQVSSFVYSQLPLLTDDGEAGYLFLRLTNSAVTGSFQSAYYANSSSQPTMRLRTNTVFETKFIPEHIGVEAGTNMYIIAGLMNTASSANSIPGQGVFFINKSSNLQNSNWVCISITNSVFVASNQLTIPYLLETALTVSITASSNEAKFWTNGVLAATHTLPVAFTTNWLMPCVSLCNPGTNAAANSTNALLVKGIACKE